ncbi:hypothetical protein C0Q70_14135 [Pomacea canaliculata]|uniref:Uncharacterized protein n=1 Tax=Pomacea canaliculata TaxID=400727 RepID=A0A2T7NZ56_POMCA|nr:hypothetical protein C0Q70_14135 [Pomacea canaliculata]
MYITAHVRRGVLRTDEADPSQFLQEIMSKTIFLDPTAQIPSLRQVTIFVEIHGKESKQNK